MVTVQLLLFAKAKELAGNRAQVELQVETGEYKTYRDFLDKLVLKQIPSLSVIAETSVLAVNDEYIDLDANCELKQGDNIAIIPPISGG